MAYNTAVYPGSYDPLTNGHIDIIERGLKIFDKIIVAALKNPSKTYLFTLNERLDILKDLITIVRGLRAISDFDIEFQMALMNRKIKPEIETIFLVPSISYSFLSSKLVKEIYQLGGEIKSMVPNIVNKKLKEKYKR